MSFVLFITDACAFDAASLPLVMAVVLVLVLLGTLPVAVVRLRWKLYRPYT